MEVDETVVGGREQNMKGRSHGKKKKVIVGLEMDYPDDDGQPKIKNSSAYVLEDYSSHSLKNGIDQITDSSALIITDGWCGYPNAAGDRWHEIVLSDQGSNFPHLHRHIFNLKNWLRGIHHSVSLDQIAAYLDEFNF